MQQFQVTITYNIEATDRREAALKAFSLTNDATPDTYEVKDAAAMSKTVVLSKEDQDEALKRAFDGTLFESE